MPQKKKAVTLTPDEQHELETFVAHGKKSAREITRARILLLAQDGRRATAIAQTLGVSRGTIYNVYKRYKPRETRLDACKKKGLGERRGTGCLESEGVRMPTKTCALVERLQTVPDPRRQSANLKHPRVDILILGFCGVLAGCEDFVEIAEWAREHEEVFSTFLELPHGIPSHDTFNRVFAMLHATTLQAVLLP